MKCNETCRTHCQTLMPILKLYSFKSTRYSVNIALKSEFFFYNLCPYV